MVDTVSDNSEVCGTLVIRAVVGFNPLDGNRRSMAKTIVLESFGDLTRAQARSMWEDWKGQNLDSPNVQGEWTARVFYW